MRLAIISTLMLTITWAAKANEGFDFFEKKIRPVLKAQCYRCHSNEDKKVKGGLIVDSKVGMLEGGDSGPAIVPGDLDKSILWKSITYQNDMEMPPKKKLPDNVIADFKKWIEMGAPDPRKESTINVKTKVSPEDIEKGKKFWAYTAPEFTKPAPVKNKMWGKSPIDHYVLSGLESKGMNPPSDASSYLILKRLCFDLAGLPPSPEQIRWFTEGYKKDPDGAIAGAVDYLLGKSSFGERWGRHWLDTARYAESNGRELNTTFPQAWRYRNYVIDSFNQDKPYDEFITEQIAGDLLKTKSDEEWNENLIATGFLALGPKTLTDNDRRQFTADLIDEQIDVVTRGVMGISVACARCHDHKFEPIPQSDYYALAGIFLSSHTYYGGAQSQQNRYRTTLIKLPVKDKEAVGKTFTASEITSMKEKLFEAEQEFRDTQIEARKQRMSGNTERNQQTIQKIRRSQRLIFELKERIDSMDSNGNKIAYCMGMQPATPRSARIFEKGEVSKPGQEIERGYVQVIGGEKPSISNKANGRLELAKWLTSEKNPLTARVAVNRIWEKLVGEGIVRSTDNFGSTGEKPTHPELLDYLAIKFMQNNWSVKYLIKEIVTSRTYRMASTFNSAYFKADPDNKMLWRYSPKRVDAEVIRDSILMVSGQLDQAAPTASVVGEQGHTIAGGRAFFRSSANQYDPPAAKYRSVYLPVVRDMLPVSLKSFDFPESMLTGSKREQNNTSTQALYMMNNKFIIVHSDLMAKKLRKEFKNKDEQIKQAFLLCYGRPPLSSELSAARNLYSSFHRSKDLKNKKEDTKEFVALSSICQSLFASAEFRYQN